MPYYFVTPNNVTSNASASTNTAQLMLLGIAGLRAAMQKLMGGTFVTPADNATLLRAYNTTVLSTTGGPITPQPMAAGNGATGAIAANALAYTTPALGTLATVPKMQLAFNQRGTAMWAAFNADEGIGFQGSVQPNAELTVVNQSTGTSVPIYTTVIHSE
jgi:hypothetical protein